MSQLFNTEAEQSVIASVINGGTDAVALCKIVSAQDFHDMRHQPVWSGVASLAARGEHVDLITLSNELEHMSTLAEVGGLSGLSEIVMQAPASSVAEKYASIVADLAVRRRVLDAMRKAATEISASGSDIKAALSGMQSHVGTLMPADGDEGLRLAREYLDAEFITPLDNRMQGLVPDMGLSTGIRDLDKAMGGMMGNKLIVVAARPGMGKTALMMEMIAANLSPDCPVQAESLEMTREELFQRLVCCVGNIPLQFVDSPASFDEHKQQQYFAQMAHPVNQIQSAALYISEEPGVSIRKVRERAMAIKERHGKVGLILIDYLGKMGVDGSYQRTDQEIGEAVKGGKDLAKELGCPVVMLAQLNRGVEQRPNKRPIMSDLKDSGDVEQEADFVISIYRDEYYNKDNPDNKGLVEFSLMKARGKALATIHAAARLSHARFEDLPEDGIQQ